MQATTRDGGRGRGPVITAGQMAGIRARLDKFGEEPLTKYDVAKVLTDPDTGLAYSHRTVAQWAADRRLEGSIGSDAGGRLFSPRQVLAFVEKHFTVMAADGSPR